MFKIVKDKLTKLSESEAQFQLDIADDLKDKFASRVGWSPCVSGGNNHTSQKLNQVNSSMFVYKPSFSTKLLLLFLLSGTIVPLIGAFSNKNIFWIGLIISFFFFLFLLHSYNRLGKKIYFDKMIKMIYKSSKPKNLIKQKNKTNHIKFNEVHAIQLLFETVRKRRNNYSNGINISFFINPYYSSYELNLVLKNGSRINIIDHKNDALIYNDAETLAKLLNVKIWDASSIDYDEI